MTNGEKIKEIFPNLEWIFNAESEYYKTYIDGIHRHCFDSDWWHSEYEEPTTKNDLETRFISKSDVDRIIDCPYFRQADKLIQIMNLPPVTPQEPKTGYWIESSNGWMCSECNKDNTFDTNYCPNCGAKMIKSQESEDKKEEIEYQRQVEQYQYNTLYEPTFDLETGSM